MQDRGLGDLPLPEYLGSAGAATLVVLTTHKFG